MKPALLTIALLMLFLSFSQAQNNNLKLWYKHEGKSFQEALPLGNGSFGIMMYGGINKERLSLNESTLWTGAPVKADINKNAGSFLPKVRDGLFNEDYKLADSLMRNMQGPYSESYEPLGNLFMDIKNNGTPTDYRRELDIQNAVATVEYKINQTTFTREIFVSFPDKIAVIKMAAKGKEKLNVTFYFNSLLKNKTFTHGNDLIMQGNAPAHASPNYMGDVPNAVVYDDKKGMRFYTQLNIKKTDGSVQHTDTSITINNASSIELLLSAATSFNGFDKDPVDDGKDEKTIVESTIKNASSKTYDLLKQTHTNDYKKYFDRVSLSIGNNDTSNNDSEEKLLAFTNDNKDYSIVPLYFQFGRYLMISSSRPDGFPTNLQGIWNEELRPPWSSNYTVNINTEMNYWLAENCNLSELHQPLFNFMDELSKTGSVTAKNFYNCSGWCCHHNTDIWAMTNPVGDGKGDPQWANWMMAGVWLSSHLWEHYAYTLDKDFLQNKAYILMKGSVQFCLDYLVKDKQGFLVTAPSISPENIYITDKGYEGATMYGGTADLAMIRELFIDFIKASDVLQTDKDLELKVKEALQKMYPYQVGKAGNLQEWYHDWKDAEPTHRHVSHLFSVYPGASITTDKTPDLAKAAKRSLEIRTNNATGWGIAWRINLWARLHNPDMALDCVQKLIHYSGNKGNVEMHGGGTYPNFFDAHPPFQIDGNFGGTAGIAEMLMQSHQGYIELLPALPNAWKNGEVKGLVARGNFIVDIKWNDGIIVASSITSRSGGVCKVKYKSMMKEISTEAGKSYQLKFN